MSEYRQDPFTGRWAVVAEGRGARPNEHASSPPSASADPNCPFCEGREARTPPEVGALRRSGSAPDGPGWSVRAIPNRFPTVEGAPAGPGPTGRPPSPDRRPGAGLHEVVIETPAHAPGLPFLEESHLRALFRFLRDRVRALEGRPGISSVVLFENWGPESGGTLWHPHAQLVATELLAPRLAEELERFAAAGAGPCLLESVTRADEADRTRVILADEHFVAVAPFGAEHPFEIRFVPRRHATSFSDATDAEADALARHLPAALRALGRLVPGVSYNWVVHGLASGTAGHERFHWHVEVLPRLVRADGFELGSGLSVNPLPPELAASQLAAELGAGALSVGRKR